MWPAAGVLAAIAVTTALDATGLSAFSALPLAPLAGLAWYLQKLTRSSVGLRWGRPHDYLLALLYPVLLMGAVALAAHFSRAIDWASFDGGKAAINVAIVAVSTFLVVIVTEEGFFRGWLWASLERAGLARAAVLVSTSVAFTLWHVSAVTLETGFDLPARQIPVYLVNATIMGLMWGTLRAVSGSVIVPALSHGVWNGLAYVLFGFGTRQGALGVDDTAVLGPEAGILGLIVNAVIAAAVWWRMRRTAVTSVPMSAAG